MSLCQLEIPKQEIQARPANLQLQKLIGGLYPQSDPESVELSKHDKNSSVWIRQILLRHPFTIPRNLGKMNDISRPTVRDENHAAY
jgi:hypothetical protein